MYSEYEVGIFERTAGEGGRISAHGSRTVKRNCKKCQRALCNLQENWESLQIRTCRQRGILKFAEKGEEADKKV